MKQRHKITILTLLALPLILGFTKWEKREKDPFITARAMPFVYPSLNGEPKFSSQFHFNHINRGTVLNNYRGAGVTVAIIDSGLNTTHEDFLDGATTNISNKSAYVEETGTSYSNIQIQSVEEHGRSIIEDTHPEAAGHGTNVASTVGAMVNGVGTAGISANVTLLVLKTNYMFTEINAAIYYAADNGADIINMSLGAYEESFIDGHGKQQNGIEGASTYFQTAINYAYNKGVTVIAAAGNEKTDHYSYPASNNNVIGVGALGRNTSTTIASYSNFGLHNVDIVSPGSVYVADIGGVSAYTETQGTSFAAPIVASAAAIYKGKYPTATPAKIEQRLKETAYDLGAAGPDATFGYGRLDLSALLVDEVPVTGVEINPTSLTLRVGDTSQVSATILPENASNKNHIFISENDAIATVNEDTGVVTAHSVGTTRIGVLTDDLFEAYTDVTVVAAGTPLEITGLDIVDTTINLGVGATKTLDINLTPNNANYNDLNFVSNNESVATISSAGVVTALKSGIATITASAKVGTKSDTVTINVLNVTNTTETYYFKDQYWGATPANWTSVKDAFGYDTNRVQVTKSASGASATSPKSFTNIQGITFGVSSNASKGAGTVKVYLKETATSTTKTEVGSFTISSTGGTTRRESPTIVPSINNSGFIQFEVICSTNSVYIHDIKIDYQEVVPDPVAVTGVTINPKTLSLTVGENSQATFTIAPSNATNKEVTFSSLNTSVATVTSDGLITAVSEGSTTIRVTTTDGNKTDDLSLTVSPAPVYEPYLNVDFSAFKKNYIFGEALALSSIMAEHRASNGTITNLTGTDLTLVSGSTKELGVVPLNFSYDGLTASVNITVTNVGSYTGAVAKDPLTIKGDSFAPAISTTTGTNYSSLSASGYTFAGVGLRNLDSYIMVYTSGHFRNVSALETIKSLKLDYKTGGSSASVQAFRFGTTEITSASGAAHTTLTSSAGGTSATVNAPAGTTHFRIDVSSKNLQANITITFESGSTYTFTAAEQAAAYEDYFMAVTHEECLVTDVKLTTWNHLKTEFDAMLPEAQNLIRTTASVEFNARYNIIVAGYGYTNFLVSGGTGLGRDLKNFENKLPILIMGLGLPLSVCFYIALKKRKKTL